MPPRFGKQGTVVTYALVIIGAAKVDDLSIAGGFVAAMVEIIANANDAFRGEVSSPIRFFFRDYKKLGHDDSKLDSNGIRRGTVREVGYDPGETSLCRYEE